MNYIQTSIRGRYVGLCGGGKLNILCLPTGLCFGRLTIHSIHQSQLSVYLYFLYHSLSTNPWYNKFVGHTFLGNSLDNKCRTTPPSRVFNWISFTNTFPCTTTILIIIFFCCNKGGIRNITIWGKEFYICYSPSI
jgi:hypothetical protein